MKVPLYGQPDAGLCWYESIDKFLTDDSECRFSRGEVEPCVYDRRVGSDGSEHVNMNLYVDDGKLYYDSTAAARAEAERIRGKLQGRWHIKFQEENQRDTHLLSANIRRHNASWTSIRMQTYIEKAVRDHLAKPLESYPRSWARNPCDKGLMRDYETALNKTDMLSGKEAETYGTLVGVLQFATAFRPDVAFPVGVGGRCRTFPTEAMYRHMERVLVYLGHTAELAINYVSSRPDSAKLSGCSDSDWYIRRSTTGYVITLACGAVAHGSHRQHCIANSSTEAEMMALADLALEMLYVIELLKEMGHEFDEESLEAQTDDPEAHRLVHAVGDAVRLAGVGDIKHGPVEVGVDNKGAYDLCHRTTAGKNSRHVERKVWKMRELQRNGKVKLILVPTADMRADMLTKPLDDETFRRHRDTVMNISASGQGITGARS